MVRMVILLFCLISRLLAVKNQWKWIGGYSDMRYAGVYGTKGIADEINIPGRRKYFNQWYLKNHKVFLVGFGEGYDFESVNGPLSDLWEFSLNESSSDYRKWKFIKGSEQQGQRSTGMGWEAYNLNDFPGGRMYTAGSNVVSYGTETEIFIFGGEGLTSGSYGCLSSLCSYRYESSLWGRFSGGGGIGASSQYTTSTGEKTDYDAIGCRYSSILFLFGSDIFYIFGGYGLAQSSSQYGYLSDTWLYDRTESNTLRSIWLSGEKTVDQISTGSIGSGFHTLNHPSGRRDMCGWKIHEDSFAIFGGYGIGSSGSSINNLDQLWIFNTSLSQWSWVSGTLMTNSHHYFHSRGVYNADNTPGSINGCSCDVFNEGEFFVIGGVRLNLRNTITVYNVEINEWKWIDGSLDAIRMGDYSHKGLYSDYPRLGSRQFHGISATENEGEVLIFGGIGYDENEYTDLNDLFSYSASNGGQFRYLSGFENLDTRGIYKTDTSHFKLYPGRREKGATCKISERYFILFGGNGASSTGIDGFLNDIFEYDTYEDNFDWVGGEDYENAPPKYGNYFEFSNEYYPGAGGEGTVTKLKEDIFIWFGGFGIEITGDNFLNTMYVYNRASREFALYFGDHDEDSGIYSSIASFDESAYIGCRKGHVAFSFLERYFVVFGGNGKAVTVEIGDLNDVWIYDMEIQQWGYFKGHSSLNNFGNYGTQMEYSNDACPGARTDMIAFKMHDSFIIYGGSGKGSIDHGNHLADMWEYNFTMNMWRFRHGSNIGVNHANSCIYSIEGDGFHETNLPSGLYGAVGWHISQDDNIYLLGGRGYECDGFGYGMLSEFWHFNLTKNQWRNVTDITRGTNAAGIYGERGLFNDVVHPGARVNSHSFTSDGKLYLFGGYGRDRQSRLNVRLSDLFYYQVSYGCNGYVTTHESVCSTHGNCIFDNTCLCENTYFGHDCEISTCYETLGNSTSVCSSNGKCIDYNTCKCDESYSGNECEIAICFGTSSLESTVCSSFGTCISKDTCSCMWGTKGNNCEQFAEIIYLFIAIPISIFILLLICLIVTFILCLCRNNIKKSIVTLKAARKLENIELLLEEQELEKDVSIAHLKINKKLFEIKYEDLKVLKSVGQGGGNGIVYKCQWRGTQTVAFKCFKIHDFLSQEKFSEFETEANILANINHPNVLQFFGCCLSPPRVGIITAFCENGDIQCFVTTHTQKYSKPIELKEKVSILKGIASGMDYLHSKNIIHRDLKCANVLIDDQKNPRIMDFGISKMVENVTQTMTKRIGTTYYIAPEVTLGEQYDEKCDVFSFAMMTYELFSEVFEPFSSTTYSVEFKLANDPNFRPTLEKNEKFTKNWQLSLIQKCWNHYPKNRPSFKEIYKLIEEGIEKEKTPEKEIKIQIKSKGIIGNDVYPLFVDGITIFDIKQSIGIKWRAKKLEKLLVKTRDKGLIELKSNNQLKGNECDFVLEFEKTDKEKVDEIRDQMISYQRRVRKYESKYGKLE